MSTIDESPDINKKRKENKGNIDGDELTVKNGAKFLASVVYTVLIIFGYFSLSGFVLFGCKVAQSNIMPTSANCYPYENAETKFYKKDTECNIFETLFEDENKSEKIFFTMPSTEDTSSPFILNTKNSILDWLREKKHSNDYRFLYR